ncbi:unnamed protein product, partial [Lymnaea stagnalis]
MSTCLPIVLVCAFLAMNTCSAIGDFDQVKTSCSNACQVTVDLCKAAAQSSDAKVTTNCDLMTATAHNVTSHQCLVKNGLCTQNEFIKLKNAACNESVEAKSVESSKVPLYSTTISKSCLTVTLNCIRDSRVSTVLKQQDQYCEMFRHERTAICLNHTSCRSGEVIALNTASCQNSSTTTGGFSAAIIASSRSYKFGLDGCSSGVSEVEFLIQREQYCSAMNVKIKGYRSPHECLVDDQSFCTQSEW